MNCWLFMQYTYSTCLSNEMVSDPKASCAVVERVEWGGVGWGGGGHIYEKGDR